MGLFGTSNNTLMNTMQSNQQAQFKTMNNLLTLQENHVEDFFQYHGEAFLAALAQLMTDTVEKVLGQMLPQIAFVTNNNGDITMSPSFLFGPTKAWSSLRSSEYTFAAWCSPLSTFF